MRQKSGKPFSLLKDGLLVVLLLVMGTLIAARLDGINQESFTGRFTAVDGDTVAQGGERFRLIGIDAPELRQTCGRNDRKWPCGSEARDFLRMLMDAGDVECSGNERDRYGRLLVRCSAGAKDVAAEMVSAGYAITTEYFLFSQEQASARERRAGIWSGTFDQPKDWRREHKAADMDVPLSSFIGMVRHALGW